MPVTPTFPGVFVQEVPDAPKPIAGVSTSITGFMGWARRGPHKPKQVRSFMAFEQTFGGLVSTSDLGYAVKQFFENQGTNAWIVRVKKTGTASSGPLVKAADLARFDSVPDLNLLCLPGVSDPASLAAADAYCKSRRMFLIIDAPKSARLPADILASVANLPRSESAAVYYSWINITDPVTGAPRLSPPSGTIAGVYARIDNNRGVWKAPAGTEANLLGVPSLAYSVTDAENGTLNSQGVNCLRSFPDIGLVAWGARTLAGSDQANSEYKYIPVRRLALFLEESLYRGLKWVEFEPNDEPLWVKVRALVTNFLTGMFQDGAFAGSKVSDSCFVKCDRDTMTQDDIANGRLICQVGFAPLRPAEFVILRIQQKAMLA